MHNDDFHTALYKGNLPEVDKDSNISFDNPIECLYKDFHEDYLIMVTKVHLNDLTFSGYRASNYHLSELSMQELINPSFIKAIEKKYPEYFI